VIQFAYPLALLALLAVPVILALYLLQPRRRRVVLSTTSLWRAALRESERAVGLRRLLRNLSLLLLLASALALGLGAAGPERLASTSEGADTVLLIDVSASMKTRSGIGTTRFDQALVEAAGIVDGLPRGGRMLVMTSGRKPVLRTGFESNPDALRRALAQLRPSDEAGRPREALALALALLQNREHGRIYFLTDGAFDGDAHPDSPQIEYRIVGNRARNVAITRFDFRQELARDDHFQVLLTVRNFTDAPVAVPASVTLGDRVLFRRSLELAALGEQTLVVPFPGRAIGPAVARIDVDDDLAADNQAFAAVNPPDSLRVLLFTRGNFYLESALEALPGLELVKRDWSPGEDVARLALLHDVVVFDGVAAPKLPRGRFLLVNTVAPGLPFSDAGRVERPGILGPGQSALMRDVDLTAVRIGEARRVVVDRPVPGLQRLFRSRETDLALALLDDGLKLVYLGFDLARSNFPLQAAFPLFVSQSLEWVRPRGEDRLSAHIAAGSTHAIHVLAAGTPVVVHMPSGNSETLVAKDGPLQFDRTADAGIYRYTVGDAERYFAVTLTDARESDVNSRWRSRGQHVTAPPASDGVKAFVPLWPLLLALALALLTVEWCVWTGSRSGA